MKTDIRNTADIALLVETFYGKVLNDDVIGFFFTEIHPIDKEAHFPVMIQFWESALLGKASYRGNPMRKHIMLDQHSSLKEEHFNRWTETWDKTIDALFEGDIAEEAKRRAGAMKQIIQLKIKMSKERGFIQ